MLQKQANSFRRSALTVCGAIGLALVVTVTSQAWSVAGHANHLTFSGAVKLPGVALPAGTYTFEVANPDTSANVIRVSSRDGRIRFLGFTERVERPPGLPKDRLVSIGESAAASPPPILAWYPFGESTGHRFIYR
jgi:hypothetical protein